MRPIFDDSLYARTGGKGTDLCGKVFDHNDHRMRLGYRMMTGGWTNGEAFIIFSQTLLTTQDEKLMVGPDSPFDRRTIRGRCRAAAKEKRDRYRMPHGQGSQKGGNPL